MSRDIGARCRETWLTGVASRSFLRLWLGTLAAVHTLRSTSGERTDARAEMSQPPPPGDRGGTSPPPSPPLAMPGPPGPPPAQEPPPRQGPPPPPTPRPTGPPPPGYPRIPTHPRSDRTCGGGSSSASSSSSFSADAGRWSRPARCAASRGWPHPWTWPTATSTQPGPARTSLSTRAAARCRCAPTLPHPPPRTGHPATVGRLGGRDPHLAQPIQR
jgi:hypothetical protein